MSDDDPQVTPETSPGTGDQSAPDPRGDDGPQGDGEEGAAPARRRRRGRRGGRRHRRKGGDEAAATVTEVGETAGAEGPAAKPAVGPIAGSARDRASSSAIGVAARPAESSTAARAGGKRPKAKKAKAEPAARPAEEAGAKDKAKAKAAEGKRAKAKAKKAKAESDAEAPKQAKAKAKAKGKAKAAEGKAKTAEGKRPKAKKAKAGPVAEAATGPAGRPAVGAAESAAAGAGRPGATLPGVTLPGSVSAETPGPSAGGPEPAPEPSSPRRRGHRGGRGRRRKVSEAVGATAEIGAAVAADDATSGSDGVVPASATGGAVVETAAEQQPSSPRRRGHRGGRGRRGAPATAEQAVAVQGETATAHEVSASDEALPAAVEQAGESEAAAAAEGGEPAAPVRRSRGGRRRPKPAGEHPSPGHESVERGSELSADAPVAGGVTAALEAAEEEQEEPARRSGRGRRGLARVEGGRADLPEHKEILVTVEGDELRVALVEDGRLAEIYIERPGKRSYAGNIYRGKVDNVIPGMDAAFVEIGLEKNGFLYVDEVAVEDEEKRPRHITEVLKPRQELLVQVMKDPMGSKGARLTGQLSLAGRYLVYVPGGSGVGVSRRLGAVERDRLREICKQLRPKKAGLIVRTVAEGNGLEELRRDMQYLSRLWSRLKVRAEKITAPGLLYEEADVSLQVARDLFNDTFETVIVDDKKQRDKFVTYLKKEAPELADRVRAYEGERPLFEEYGIEEQIAEALERRVRLPSGGNIVIDHAEALTVIDVNTGRYTAGRDLEETITRTNLEAAREVVRQLRLRDIGGIIIIDFIDMAYARNRDAVLAKLQAELDTDRTKTYVVEISPLGLVEMTRQNITDGARGILTKECPSCSGKARILSEDTAARNAVRTVRRQAKSSPHEAFLFEVNHHVAERIAGMGWLTALEKETGKRIFFEGSQTLPVDSLGLIAKGTRQDVERQRVPVQEGQELEVELEHTLTYSPGDAVAHVDGYVITVLGGRPFLGQRRKVKISAMTRTGAFATLAGKRKR